MFSNRALARASFEAPTRLKNSFCLSGEASKSISTKTLSLSRTPKRTQNNRGT